MWKWIATPVTMTAKQPGGLRKCHRIFHLGNPGSGRATSTELVTKVKTEHDSDWCPSPDR